ncbi:MAG: hypothetical protein AAB834_05640 [Patescibacteria group bacterium]
MYTSGTLSGIGPKKTSDDITRMLLHNTTRTIGDTIPAPLLPGLYKATYGYRTDTNQTIQRSSYLLYIPLWSIAALLGLSWLGWRVWLWRRTHKT